MPHEIDGQLHWHEPLGLEPAGARHYRRPATAYDRFVEADCADVVRGSSVPDLAEVALRPWPRLGGRGRYLQLAGTEQAWGSYLVEVQAAGALLPERHLFEKICLVLAGRGTTEIWRPGGRPHVFEWQQGAMFAIPLNMHHRLVNATEAPALLLTATTAPGVLNLLGDPRAVFDNAYAPDTDEADPFAAADAIEPDPLRGLALCRTHLLPDALGCDLPLDNRLSPGYRQLELAMTSTPFHLALGQHRPGRYGRAFVLPEAAMQICLAGIGFSYLWPERLGPTPWQDGQGDAVIRVEHRRFSAHAAGPGGGRWYVQSFGLSKQPLRLALWSGPGLDRGPPGEELEAAQPVPYAREDPSHRPRHTAAMAKAGIIDRMRDEDYAP